MGPFASAKSRVSVSLTCTGAKCPPEPSKRSPKISAKKRAAASLSRAETMVWLSVIVMGFLLLGRLAQTLLARCFEGGGPPCQLIEHLPGGLIEMLEIAQRLAVFYHGTVIGEQDGKGGEERSP